MFGERESEERLFIELKVESCYGTAQEGFQSGLPNWLINLSNAQNFFDLPREHPE